MIAGVRPKTTISNRMIWLGGLVLATVVAIAYGSALNLSFVGDDWIFFELAGRLNLQEYLVKYFDPRVQTAWYRPVQGVLFRIGYDVFGKDQVGYHLVNVLFHYANSLVLYLLIGYRLGKWRVALFAGLLFATFPIAVEGVFKTGVIDPVTALFFLLTMWFWLRHLENDSPRAHILAFGCFLIALLSKEISVTLPVVLFLLDRLYVRKPAALGHLMRRYAAFVLVWALYLPLELIVTQRSVFVHREGYQPTLQAFSNLIDYLAGLAFPWAFSPFWSRAWLALVTMVLAYLVFVRRWFSLVPVVVGAILAVLPIVLFPQVSFRFLYVSLTGTAFLLALALDWACQYMWRKRGRWVAYLIVALVALVGSAQIAGATAEFAEFARVSRVSFRNFRQAHPTLPADTFVYFVDPPIPGPNLSGMFFWYYGSNVVATANDSMRVAGLRDHSETYVEYYDPDGNQKEQRVQKDISARSASAFPVEFAAPIQLDGFELANGKVTPGDSILLFLYWRGRGRIDTDYLVSVNLADDQGKVLASRVQPPRRGEKPTSEWTRGELVVDVVQVPVPPQTPAGTYRLELGLVDPGTSQRIANSSGSLQVVTIGPLSIAQ